MSRARPGRIVLTAAALVLAGAAALTGPPAAAGAATPLAPLPPGTAESYRQRLAEIYADYYGLPIATVELLMRAGLNDDDVSVICLLATTGAGSAGALAVYRLQKLPWAEVFAQLHAPARLLAPTPPSRVVTGRLAQPLAAVAADPDAPPRLTDDQIRDLVQLKVAVEYYALDPAAVSGWRARGVASTRILLSQHVASGGRPTGRRVQLPAPPGLP